MPKEIAGLAGDMLQIRSRSRVTPAATTVERVDQHVFFVDGAAKRDLLVELMRDADVSRAIIFTRTKRGADRVAQHLDAAGVGAQAIHGNKSQNQRVRTLDNFKSGATRVLVATDIAARGIDVDAVSHVVNFELPEVPEGLCPSHRPHRARRLPGRAISLCDNSERPLLRQIEKLTRQTLAFTDRRTAAGARDDEREAARPAPRGRGGQGDGGRRGGPQPQRRAGPRDGSAQWRRALGPDRRREGSAQRRPPQAGRPSARLTKGRRLLSHPARGGSRRPEPRRLN